MSDNQRHDIRFIPKIIEFYGGDRRFGSGLLIIWERMTLVIRENVKTEKIDTNGDKMIEVASKKYSIVGEKLIRGELLHLL